MIVGIEGFVAKKELTYVFIKLNGITYKVFTSLYCNANISQNDNISLNITQIIKEESSSLYGFIDADEQYIFDTLIKINGIGAKVAMAICSTISPSEFANIIKNNDIDALKKVPGIGNKGASRILLELNNFLMISEDSGTSSQANDAIIALESLGFTKQKITKALAKCTQTETNALIKEALRIIV